MKKNLLILYLTVMTCITYGQLTGTKAIPGDYPTIAAAVSAINTLGVGATGVTFDVAAGHTETSSNILFTTNTGSAANPIIFHKSGTGANPLITAAPGVSTTNDGIVVFGGTDYVTFDGIDVRDTCTTTDIKRMEWGYAVMMASATDASQNITLVNCNISLQKYHPSYNLCSGIFSRNQTYNNSGTTNPTSVSGVSSNCKVNNCNISNVTHGIYWFGYASNASYYGQNNYFGYSAGNTITNFGGTSGFNYGIYVSSQNNLKIMNNNVTGGNGNIGGVWGINAAGSGTNSNVEISYNTVNVVSAANANAVYGIQNALGASGTNNMVSVCNNTITISAPELTSGTLYGLYMSNVNAWRCDVSGNSVVNCQQGGGVVATATGSFYGIFVFGSNTVAGSLWTFNLNNISNNSRIQSTLGGGNTYGMYLTSSGLTCTISGNNIMSNSWPSTGNVWGINVSNSSATTLNIFNNKVGTLTRTTAVPNVMPRCGATTGIQVLCGATNGIGNIYSNEVTDLVNSWGGPVTCFRINGAASSTAKFYQNLAHNAVTVDQSVTGISTEAGINVEIYKNKVHDLHATVGDSGCFYGISTLSSTGSGVVAVYNNYISDLTAPEANKYVSAGLYQVSTQPSTIHRYYNNSVYLDQVATAGNPVTAAVYSKSGPTLDLRNNVLVNNSTTLGTGYTVAYMRSDTSLTSHSNNSNYNCLYAGTPGIHNLLLYAYDDYIPKKAQNIFNYINFLPQEGQSFRELPPFMNVTVKPYNLKISETIYTACESGGSVIVLPPITTDYENDPRYPNPGYPNNPDTLNYAKAPDIGADEFGGISKFNCEMPVTGLTLASANNICQGDPVTLSLQYPVYGTGISFQWQSSSDSVTFTDISGANSYIYIAYPSMVTFYRCIVSCVNGPVSDTSDALRIYFNSRITSVTNGQRCGYGPVTLGATATPGATISWYANPTGGAPVGTGTTYTTPVISNTTTYYVTSKSGTRSNDAGKMDLTPSQAANPINLGSYLSFTALSYFKLHSVNVYPIGTGAGSVTISLQTSTGVTLESRTVDVIGTSSPSSPAQTVILDLDIAGGENYRLTLTGVSGNVTNLYRDQPIPAYPFILPGIVSITGGSGSTAFYYHFYKWNVITDCESGRTPVLAVVTAPPAMTATATPSAICVGQSSVLNVTSSNPNYTYLWSPGDMSGAQQTVSPLQTTIYELTATDASSGCVNVTTVPLMVYTTPTPITITPPAPVISAGQTVMLTASGGSLTGSCIFGTSNNSNPLNSWPAPYSNYLGGNKHQMLIRASELISAGMYAGVPITSVTFKVANVGTSFGGFLENFQIDMALTNVTQLSSTSFVSGLTTVFAPATVPITLGNNTHILTSSFVWDGVSNLVVQTNFCNGNLGGSAYGVQMTNSNPGFVSSNWYFSSTQSASQILGATVPINSSMNRPNMVLGFSAPTTFYWSPFNFLYTSGSLSVPYNGQNLTTVFSKPTHTITYTVSASTGITGCASSQQVTVTIPSSLVLEGTVTNTSCFGASNGSISAFVMGGVPPYSYLWSTGATTSVITGLSGGVYSLTVSDITTATITGSWSVLQPADFTISSVVTPATCPTESNGAINLTVNGGSGTFSYAWSNGGTTEDVTGLAPGSYQVTVTGEGNCSKTESFIITAQSNICNYDTVTGSYEGSYCFNALIQLTVQNLMLYSNAYVDLIAGQKILILPGTSVMNGGYLHARISSTMCNQSDNLLPAISLTKEQAISGSHTIFTLYPNPTTGNITILQKGNRAFSEVKIEVYNMNGIKVITDRMSGMESRELSTLMLSEGIYLVRITADSEVETLRLVKMK